MDDAKKLREQAANFATEARSLLDQASKEKDETRSVELEAQHDKAMGDYDKSITRAEKIEKLDAAKRKAELYAEAEERKQRDNKRPEMNGVETPTDAMDYRTAFHDYLRAQGQKGEMSEEARAVLASGYQSVESRAQVSGTNSAGGFTVPTELQAILVKSMAAWGPMYDEDICTTITTTGGGSLPMPTVNDTGVTAGAHIEGATLTDDGGKDATFGQKTLEAYARDSEWIRVSKELADDSIFAMESLLGGLLGERLGRIANLDLTTGNGSSNPNGIVTASSLGNTATGTAAITWDEIFDLEHSVDPAYRVSPKARYMFNDSTLLAVRKLKDGAGNYLWQMGDVKSGIPATFNGRAYSINQAMASLGAANKVMLFGDFSKYFVRKVGAPLIGAIQDKDFWPGFGIAGYIRFDGELADTAAVKHLITAAV